jgi:hypothetical protein
MFSRGLLTLLLTVSPILAKYRHCYSEPSPSARIGSFAHYRVVKECLHIQWISPNGQQHALRPVDVAKTDSTWSCVTDGRTVDIFGAEIVLFTDDLLQVS